MKLCLGFIKIGALLVLFLFVPLESTNVNRFLSSRGNGRYFRYGTETQPRHFHGHSMITRREPASRQFSPRSVHRRSFHFLGRNRFNLQDRTKQGLDQNTWPEPSQPRKNILNSVRGRPRKIIVNNYRYKTFFKLNNHFGNRFRKTKKFGVNIEKNRNIRKRKGGYIIKPRTKLINIKHRFSKGYPKIFQSSQKYATRLVPRRIIKKRQPIRPQSAHFQRRFAIRNRPVVLRKKGLFNRPNHRRYMNRNYFNRRNYRDSNYGYDGKTRNTENSHLRKYWNKDFNTKYFNKMNDREIKRNKNTRYPDINNYRNLKRSHVLDNKKKNNRNFWNKKKRKVAKLASFKNIKNANVGDSYKIKKDVIRHSNKIKKGATEKHIKTPRSIKKNSENTNIVYDDNHKKMKFPGLGYFLKLIKGGNRYYRNAKESDISNDKDLKAISHRSPRNVFGQDKPEDLNFVELSYRKTFDRDVDDNVNKRQVMPRSNLCDQSMSGPRKEEFTEKDLYEEPLPSQMSMPGVYSFYPKLTTGNNYLKTTEKFPDANQDYYDDSNYPCRSDAGPEDFTNDQFDSFTDSNRNNYNINDGENSNLKFDFENSIMKNQIQPRFDTGLINSDNGCNNNNNPAIPNVVSNSLSSSHLIRPMVRIVSPKPLCPPQNAYKVTNPCGHGEDDNYNQNIYDNNVAPYPPQRNTGRRNNGNDNILKYVGLETDPNYGQPEYDGPERVNYYYNDNSSPKMQKPSITNYYIQKAPNKDISISEEENSEQEEEDDNEEKEKEEESSEESKTKKKSSKKWRNGSKLARFIRNLYQDQYPSQYENGDPGYSFHEKPEFYGDYKRVSEGTNDANKDGGNTNGNYIGIDRDYEDDNYESGNYFNILDPGNPRGEQDNLNKNLNFPDKREIKDVPEYSKEEIKDVLDTLYEQLLEVDYQDNNENPKTNLSQSDIDKETEGPDDEGKSSYQFGNNRPSRSGITNSRPNPTVDYLNNFENTEEKNNLNEKNIKDRITLGSQNDYKDSEGLKENPEKSKNIDYKNRLESLETEPKNKDLMKEFYSRFFEIPEKISDKKTGFWNKYAHLDNEVMKSNSPGLVKKAADRFVKSSRRYFPTKKTTQYEERNRKMLIDPQLEGSKSNRNQNIPSDPKVSNLKKIKKVSMEDNTYRKKHSQERISPLKTGRINKAVKYFDDMQRKNHNYLGDNFKRGLEEKEHFKPSRLWLSQEDNLFRTKKHTNAKNERKVSGKFLNTDRHDSKEQALSSISRNKFPDSSNEIERYLEGVGKNTHQTDTNKFEDSYKKKETRSNSSSDKKVFITETDSFHKSVSGERDHFNNLITTRSADEPTSGRRQGGQKYNLLLSTPIEKRPFDEKMKKDGKNLKRKEISDRTIFFELPTDGDPRKKPRMFYRKRDLKQPGTSKEQIPHEVHDNDRFQLIVQIPEIIGKYISNLIPSDSKTPIKDFTNHASNDDEEKTNEEDKNSQEEKSPFSKSWLYTTSSSQEEADSKSQAVSKRNTNSLRNVRTITGSYTTNKKTNNNLDVTRDNSAMEKKKLRRIKSRPELKNKDKNTERNVVQKRKGNTVVKRNLKNHHYANKNEGNSDSLLRNKSPNRYIKRNELANSISKEKARSGVYKRNNVYKENKFSFDDNTDLNDKSRILNRQIEFSVSDRGVTNKRSLSMLSIKNIKSDLSKRGDKISSKKPTFLKTEKDTDYKNSNKKLTKRAEASIDFFEGFKQSKMLPAMLVEQEDVITSTSRRPEIARSFMPSFIPTNISRATEVPKNTTVTPGEKPMQTSETNTEQEKPFMSKDRYSNQSSSIESNQFVKDTKAESNSDLDKLNPFQNQGSINFQKTDHQIENSFKGLVLNSDQNAPFVPLNKPQIDYENKQFINKPRVKDINLNNDLYSPIPFENQSPNEEKMSYRNENDIKDQISNPLDELSLFQNKKSNEIQRTFQQSPMRMNEKSNSDKNELYLFKARGSNGNKTPNPNVNDMKDQMSKVQDKLNPFENRGSNNNNPLHQNVNGMKDQMSKVQDKLNPFENRGSNNNNPLHQNVNGMKDQMSKNLEKSNFLENPGSNNDKALYQSENGLKNQISTNIEKSNLENLSSYNKKKNNLKIDSNTNQEMLNIQKLLLNRFNKIPHGEKNSIKDQINSNEDESIFIKGQLSTKDKTGLNSVNSIGTSVDKNRKGIFKTESLIENKNILGKNKGNLKDYDPKQNEGASKLYWNQGGITGRHDSNDAGQNNDLGKSGNKDNKGIKIPSLDLKDRSTFSGNGQLKESENFLGNNRHYDTNASHRKGSRESRHNQTSQILDVHKALNEKQLRKNIAETKAKKLLIHSTQALNHRYNPIDVASHDKSRLDASTQNSGHQKDTVGVKHNIENRNGIAKTKLASSNSASAQNYVSDSKIAIAKTEVPIENVVSAVTLLEKTIEIAEPEVGKPLKFTTKTPKTIKSNANNALKKIQANNFPHNRKGRSDKKSKNATKADSDENSAVQSLMNSESENYMLLGENEQIRRLINDARQDLINDIKDSGSISAINKMLTNKDTDYNSQPEYVNELQPQNNLYDEGGFGSETFQNELDPSSFKVGNLESGSDSNGFKVETFEKKADPNEFKAETIETGSDPNGLKAGNVETGSDPSGLNTETIESGSDPSGIKAGNVETGSDGETDLTDPKRIHTFLDLSDPESIKVINAFLPETEKFKRDYIRVNETFPLRNDSVAFYNVSDINYPVYDYNNKNEGNITDNNNSSRSSSHDQDGQIRFLLRDKLSRREISNSGPILGSNKTESKETSTGASGKTNLNIGKKVGDEIRNFSKCVEDGTGCPQKVAKVSKNDILDNETKNANCKGKHCFNPQKLFSPFSYVRQMFNAYWDTIDCDGWKETVDIRGVGFMEMDYRKQGKSTHGNFSFDLTVIRKNNSHPPKSKGCEQSCNGNPSKLVINGESKTIKSENKFGSKVLGFVSGDAKGVWEPFQIDVLTPGRDCRKFNSSHQILLDGSENDLTIMRLKFLTPNAGEQRDKEQSDLKGKTGHKQEAERGEKSSLVRILLDSFIERTKKATFGEKSNQLGLYSYARERRCPGQKVPDNYTYTDNLTFPMTHQKTKERKRDDSQFSKDNMQMSSMKIFGQFQCGINGNCNKPASTRHVDCTVLKINLLNV